MKTRKILSVLLVVVMVAGLLCSSAFATNPTSLTGFGGSLSAISVSGADVTSFSLSTSTFTYQGYTNTAFTYTIYLSANTPDSGVMTINFTKAADASSNCCVSPYPPPAATNLIGVTSNLQHTVTLSNGDGTKTLYLHHDLINQRGRCDTYVFNFVRNVASTTITSTGLTMQFGDPNEPATSPECDMLFSAPANSNSFDVVYDGTIVGYYPNSLALFVTSGASGITALNTTGGVTIQPTTTDAQGNIIPTTVITTGFYIVSITDDGTVAFTTSAGTTTLSFDYPEPVPSIGAGMYACLPAPGQFTNEGINTGGWGDIYVSGSSALKGMVNGISGTGVSLGYFGGYVVADMGENVSNAAANKYGVDFIVYGNAFSGNSEPGCIQVAQAVQVDGGYVPGDANSDGVIWYDIAGSLHYEDNTVWNASYTYTNPVPSDNNVTTYPTSGTITTTGVSFSYSNNSRPGSSTVTGNGSVAYNGYHAHSWFPLYANYFIARNSIGPMDHVTSLPFATVSGNTLKLTGVMLGSATSTATGNYTFGYADVHPNGSNYGTASNPYVATASTTGGDGIDISWAVYPAKYDHTVGSYTANTANPNAGKPVNLSSIRFVRIYTGAAHGNGNLGEISTEVCGVYKATGTGSGAATTDLVVKKGSTVLTHSNMGVTDITTTSSPYQLKIYSDEDHVYVNGSSVSCTSTSPYTKSVSISAGETKYVQVITQSGTESPYITLFRITR